MSTVSISSIAVSTQRRGYSFDGKLKRGIEFQGDAGWGVAQKDGPLVMVMVAPMNWEVRPRSSHGR